MELITQPERSRIVVTVVISVLVAQTAGSLKNWIFSIVKPVEPWQIILSWLVYITSLLCVALAFAFFVIQLSGINRGKFAQNTRLGP
ncbi:MAG TPA: hypothetical protein VI934_01620 [Candidatus Nanoarchaeia archaeon]|nr:hypothetical protein [Candidatus Nanoarchaeia archaeon]